MRSKCLIGAIIVLILTNFIVQSTAIEMIEQSSMSTRNGKTLYVGGSGPGNYTKIQDAINNASDGDTVFVYSGTYNEKVLINKSIDLIGENRSNTIIEGGGLRDVVKIVASWVSVHNFYLNNSGHYDKNSGIQIYGEINNITIQNNIITNNIIGICVGDIYSSDKIRHVTIVNNLIQNRKYGVMLYVCYENTISNNTFIDNGLLIPQGYSRDNTVINNTVNGRPLIYFEQQSNKIIKPNVGQIILVMCDNITVREQHLETVCEVGIELFVCRHCNIIQNTVSNKSYGIYVLYSEQNNIQKNHMENDAYGIYLVNSDRNTISNNTISNSLDAMYIRDSNNNIISYNTMMNSRKGLDLSFSNDNIILNNVINSSREHGIDLFFSCNKNQFINNIIHNSRDAGIYILGSSQIWWDTASNRNVISGNDFKNNRWGILLEEASLTTVSSNNIFQNYYGIEIINAKYNRIINNNIFNNEQEDALFKNSFSSRFDNNYWNETKRLHIIKGGIFYYNYWIETYILVLPLIRFDWHPAQEPYDMGV